MTTATFRVRPISSDQADRLVAFWSEHWGSPYMVTRGHVHHARDLNGFVAENGVGEWVGVLTYRLEGRTCEVMSLDSLHEGQGIGTALLETMTTYACKIGVERLWLITTNDNTHALRFYQRRGWRLAAVHAGAVAEARMLKPEIPLLGYDGIPIRDEIELEFLGVDVASP